MLKIGLTGNIGCGKSSVSRELSKYGIQIIDADIISREIYEYEDMLEIMGKNFPEALVSGRVDRKKLGQIVFSDKERLKVLNGITHRKIKEVVTERLALCSKNGQIAVVDAALLYEAAFDDIVDKVAVVFCKEEEQLKRVILRDSISEEDALKRINSQMSQEEKKKRADFVIDNSGSPEELEEEIERFMKQIEMWKEEYGGM